MRSWEQGPRIAGLDDTGAGCLHHAGTQQESSLQRGETAIGCRAPASREHVCSVQPRVQCPGRGHIFPCLSSPQPTRRSQNEGRHPGMWTRSLSKHSRPSFLRWKKGGETFSWIRKQCFNLDCTGHLKLKKELKAKGFIQAVTQRWQWLTHCQSCRCSVAKSCPTLCDLMDWHKNKAIS